MGSEMCIRDRPNSKFSYRKVNSPTLPPLGSWAQMAVGSGRWRTSWSRACGSEVSGVSPNHHYCSSISGVKDAQRSRRQSIWAVYTSLRHTAKYTGFGCIPYVYSPLASSRLACQDIQRIQHIQPYSHTRHTSYSAIQPPSGVSVLYEE